MNSGWKVFGVCCVGLVGVVCPARSSGGVLGAGESLLWLFAWFLAVVVLGGRLMMLRLGWGCGIVGGGAVGLLWLLLLSAVLVGS